MHIRNRGDGALAAILFLGSVFLFYETWQIREIFSYSFGPRVFPRIILGLMALLSACLFAQSLGPGQPPGHGRGQACDHASQRAAAPSRKRDETGPASREALLRAGLIILLSAYIVALPYVGYTAATMPFLFAGMVFLGRRVPKALLLYAVLSVGITLLLKFIFGTLLKFFLP